MSELTNETKCVVEITTLSLFTWEGAGYAGKTTIQEDLQRAITSHNMDLAMFKEYATKYDSKDNEYWADRYEREKDYKYAIIPFCKYQELEREKYLSMPLYNSDKQEFWNALEVLPPEKWVTIDGVEMFCMCEHYTSYFTVQYAHDHKTDKYYSKMVDVFDQSTWIHSLLKKALRIKFVKIDGWGRPVFKVINRKNMYLCDTGHLFDVGTSEDRIKEFYTDTNLKKFLEFYGSGPDCEPEGGTLSVEILLI